VRQNDLFCLTTCLILNYRDNIGRTTKSQTLSSHRCKKTGVDSNGFHIKSCTDWAISKTKTSGRRLFSPIESKNPKAAQQSIELLKKTANLLETTPLLGVELGDGSHEQFPAFGRHFDRLKQIGF